MASSIYTLRCITQDEYNKIVESGFVFEDNTVGGAKTEDSINEGKQEETTTTDPLASATPPSPNKSETDAIEFLDKAWITFDQKFTFIDGFHQGSSTR